MPTETTAKIEKITAYSDELKVFRLKLPDSSFSFLPGQFVMVSLPNLLDDNGKAIKRAYSIASSPEDKWHLELCIARYPEGRLSPPIFKAGIGDEVIVSGPFGKFVLQKPVQPGTIFIAGGTGIATLMSMLRLLYGTGYKDKLWLFYSVSEPKLFLFKEEILGYAKHNNLQLVASTSNPDSGWQWEKGRITATFPAKIGIMNGVPKESRQFYVCGPPQMVTDTIALLEQLGFRKENIRHEQW